ncbi:MAG TPA: mechanosensitive ion channel domain-containing protein [Salinisphaeraceae bacterium]|nr:mechanosensitive ion channel domain-containing protein [Salinisphaeraceae bacterium]
MKLNELRIYRQARPLVALLLLLVLLLVALPAAASEATTAGGTTADSPVSLSELADLLENEDTRLRLVDTLRAAATDDLQASAQPADDATSAPADGADEADAKDEDTATTDTDETFSLVRELAHVTSGWAQSVSRQAASIWQTLQSLRARNTAADVAVPAFDASAFWDALLAFVLVAAATVVAFFVLRVLAAGLFGALAKLPRHGERALVLFVRRALAVVLALAADIIIVLLACGAGYAVGLLLGDSAGIGTRETLFINAFAMIEVVKAVIRAVFSARYDSLRLLPMSSAIAGWWSVRLRWFVSVVGYSLLVAVPIISAQLSPALGSVVSFVIMAAAYVYALVVIIRNRKLLGQRLLHAAGRSSIAFFAVLLQLLAHLWLPLAVIYLTILFVGSQVDPAGVLPFMLAATLQTLIAAAIAMGLSGLLSLLIDKRIPLPARTRQRLPNLEARLNAYIPAYLKIARGLILLGFILVAAHIWRLFDLYGWLASPGGSHALSVVIHVLIILAVALLLWLVLTSLLEHRLGAGPRGGPPSARQQTLMQIIRNALAITVITMTAMVILSQIGVDIGPLIAGAGVIGLAVGFGAQTLVADVISGVFIQIENALNTGDWVDMAGVSGTVERLTIRSVALRGLDGTLHVVPFSSASIVSNYNRGFGYHVTAYRIAYREDIDEAIRQLRAAFEDLQADDAVRANLLEDISIPGVTALAENAVEIRVMIKTRPGSQWATGRAYNRLVKMRFDAAGIEIPTAQRTLYFGRDKDGWSPPLRVRQVDTAAVALRADEDTSAELDVPAREGDMPARDGTE